MFKEKEKKKVNEFNHYLFHWFGVCSLNFHFFGDNNNIDGDLPTLVLQVLLSLAGPRLGLRKSISRAAFLYSSRFPAFASAMIESASTFFASSDSGG